MPKSTVRSRLRAGRRELRLQLRADEQFLVELRLGAGGNIDRGTGGAQQVFVVAHLQLVLDRAGPAGGTMADTN